MKVRLSKNPKATTRQLPTFRVALQSLDVKKIPVWLTQGGAYRSGRQARGRFEVRDASGTILPIRQLEGIGIGGGLFTQGFLKYGESWTTDLDMNSYVRIPKPGEYTVRILYHNNVTIVDVPKLADLKNLIIFSSKPFRLKVVKQTFPGPQAGGMHRPEDVPTRPHRPRPIVPEARKSGSRPRLTRRVTICNMPRETPERGTRPAPSRGVNIPFQTRGPTMLREPKKLESRIPLRRDNASGRSQIVKLEERIAPDKPNAFVKNDHCRRCGDDLLTLENPGRSDASQR